MIGVLVSWALELPFFGLIPDSQAHRNKDAGEVEVEPVRNVLPGATLDLLSHGELVGVTTGVQGDSSDEQVRTDHGGSEDHEMVALLESDDNANERDARNNGPEDGWFLRELERIANGEGKKGSSGAAKERNTVFQGVGEEDSKSKAGESAKTKDEPVDPFFSLVLHEHRVEEEQEDESGGNEGDQEDGRLDALAADEVDEETDEDHAGSPEESILVQELEQFVDIQSWTGVLGFQGELLDA